MCVSRSDSYQFLTYWLITVPVVRVQIMKVEIISRELLKKSKIKLTMYNIYVGRYLVLHVVLVRHPVLHNTALSSEVLT